MIFSIIEQPYYILFQCNEFATNRLLNQTLLCKGEDVYKDPHLKDTRHPVSQVVLNSLMVCYIFFIPVVLSKPFFHFWTPPQGSLVLSSSLPHALALCFLSWTCFLPSLGLYPRPTGLGSAPLHPSVYSSHHPSVNAPFTEATVWGCQLHLLEGMHEQCSY